MPTDADLRRIRDALAAAERELERFTPGAIEHRVKERGDPVTDADLAVNEVLQRVLPGPGDGWLSEETADGSARLSCSRVWVVDPVDGTKEFVRGIPEWCVSVGLVEDERAVAGGICILPRKLTIVGAIGAGVTVNGKPAAPRHRSTLEGAQVLASRSEVTRGEWERYHGSPFEVLPMGSVASKMALVAAGMADATWTLVPKHEWDVAAGTALVLASGGEVWRPDGRPPRFNQPRPRFDGLFAVTAGLREPVERYLGEAGIS